MSGVSNRIKIDSKTLDSIKAAFAKGGYVKVGVLGSNSGGEEINNAELGMVQEFGSLTNNIPPRSFLRMPIEKKSEEFKKVASTEAFKKAIETGEIDKALELIGIAGESIVNDAFVSSGFGEWAANAPSTVHKKGSNKPLIDTSELRRSISSEVVNNGKEA